MSLRRTRKTESWQTKVPKVLTKLRTNRYFIINILVFLLLWKSSFQGVPWIKISFIEKLSHCSNTARGFLNWLKLCKLLNIKVFGGLVVYSICPWICMGSLVSQGLPLLYLSVGTCLNSSALLARWLQSVMDAYPSVACYKTLAVRSITAFPMPKLHVWTEGAFWGIGMDIKHLSAILNGY